MTDIPYVSFLLFSGGVGARSGHHEPKQFCELDGHPMIAYSLIAAAAVDQIGEIIINTPVGFEDRTREIAVKYCANKQVSIVPGGATRQESSLRLARSAQYDTVVLHEAARPFVNRNMLLDLIGCAESNVGYCQPITFSMCQINESTGQMSKGIPRDGVFNIQLPQKFDRSTLIGAHEKAAQQDTFFNEDAVMVLEMMGDCVHALSGSAMNLKVTTPEDFVISDVMMGNIK